MTEIIFYRAGAEFVRIAPDEATALTRRIMGDHVVNLSFKDTRYITFRLGDTAEIFGEVYKINRPPQAAKKATVHWEYAFPLEAEGYDLGKAQYLFLGADNTLREPEFSLTGTAETFVDLVLENLRRVDATWTKGEVLPTDYKTLSFSRLTCLGALAKIAEAFGTEYWLEGKRVALTKKVSDRGRLFAQGRGRGLYELIRLPLEGAGLATRLYVFGGEKNLPTGYGSLRLRLPETATGGGLVSSVAWEVVPSGLLSKVATFSFTPPTLPGIVALIVAYEGPAGWVEESGANSSPRSVTMPLGGARARFTTVMSDGTTYTTDAFDIALGSGLALMDSPRIPYLEKNVGAYGLIEQTEYFDDIYPHRTGTVTAVDATSEFVAIDAALDFDINDYLINTPAKITFNTGQLTGYTFDLQSYDHGTKTIRFLKNKDEKAMEVPSPTLRPQIGDEYVLTDIRMPQSYIDAAESDLLAKATQRLEVLAQPQTAYKILFDPAYLKAQGYVPALGELLWIKDDQLGVERRLRVVSLTRNVVNEWDLTIDLSDTVTYGTIERLMGGLSTNAADIADLERLVTNRDIFNGRAQLPEVADVSALQPVYVDPVSGKLYRAV